jgi:hypothetical protein
MLAEPPELKLAIIKRVEWITAILLSAVVLFLFVVRARHAGALWLDECDSLQLARMPRLADVLANLQYTSFPVLFPATIRAYTALFGTGDISMRCFGLAVGVALVCVAWFHARTISGEMPLVFLALIGLNTTFLRAGGWIRGYGLGSVLVVLTFTLTAKLLLRPTGRRLASVFVAYLLGMQCLFFNGVLIPVLVLAAGAIWLFRGELKWLLVFLGIAVACGLSYIPYILRSVNVSEWAVVLKVPASFAEYRHQFVIACGAPVPIMACVWSAVLLVSVIGAIWRLSIVRGGNPAVDAPLLLFALLTIFISIPVSCGFLRLLHNAPVSRYYLALLCLLAIAVDLIVADLSRFYWVRLARLACVMAALVTLPLAGWSRIIERQTNIDFVAQKLQKDAKPNDLIVVIPWSLGPCFNWYYHGPARWITVPEMNEHRILRYDLLKAKMMAFFPLDDVEHEIRAALKSGDRIWIVGRAKKPPAGTAPLAVLPAPDPFFFWDNRVYRVAWSEQLATFIQRHALRAQLVMARTEAVSPDENIPLVAAEGWRD